MKVEKGGVNKTVGKGRTGGLWKHVTWLWGRPGKGAGGKSILNANIISAADSVWDKQGQEEWDCMF